jgi:A/G-specific adenine glycosylase
VLPGGSTPQDFRLLVYAEARRCWRDLPWRHTTDPYAILVSEMMLQQTQVSRVAPRFEAWLDRFPSAQSLADASPEDVLRLWSGLGYNRRALALHRAAGEICLRFDGLVPAEESALRSLPGIGEYTARAILAFAFDLPSVFLETNIRTVLLKHFFPGENAVPDSLLTQVASEVLDADNPRKWYTAMMDYGAELKRVEGNHSTRSASYRAQAPFATSLRKVRGAVLKAVLAGAPLDAARLPVLLGFSEERIKDAVDALAKEGLLICESGQVPSASREETPALNGLRLSLPRIRS